jgi:hypothetical protein
VHGTRPDRLGHIGLNSVYAARRSELVEAIGAHAPQTSS